MPLNLQLDGISAIAVIIIASFGIDRIVTGVLFLLSFLGVWSRYFPIPNMVVDGVGRVRAERKQQLLYYVLASLLGILVLAYFGEVRIFNALGFTKTHYILDSIMTGLILVAGADRISAVLNLQGGRDAEISQRPIEITGKLVLEGDSDKKFSVDSPR